MHGATMKFMGMRVLSQQLSALNNFHGNAIISVYISMNPVGMTVDHYGSTCKRAYKQTQHVSWNWGLKIHKEKRT